MINRFDETYAKNLSDDLAMRVYTSNLLGVDDNLVLHGGGNTSVKIGDLLYVKGSGWDLSDIQKEGFAPVKMDALLAMAELEKLSDSEMVAGQKAAMTDASAPNPSIEAILHALIPFKFVDHTHADAVVTLTNTPGGEQIVRELYGEKMLIVPYVMPGFILARTIYEMTRGVDWKELDGIILLNHGVFSFDDDAKKSYDKMIAIVAKAEAYLTQNVELACEGNAADHIDLHMLAALRGEAARLRGCGLVARLNDSDAALCFSRLKNLETIVHNGPLTPEHVIRTKPNPVIVERDVPADYDRFVRGYTEYFKSHENGETMLDPAPRYAVWRGHGVVSLGASIKETMIIADITAHTVRAMLSAEKLGGWKSLSKHDLFDMEYWELEQAKLKKGGEKSPLEGRVAVVVDGDGESGAFLVETLAPLCGAVVVLGMGEGLAERYHAANVLAIECDITDGDELSRAADAVVYTFGGFDLLLDNTETDLIDHDTVLNSFGSFLELGFNPKALVFAQKDTPLKGRTFPVKPVDNNDEDVTPERLIALCR